MGKPYYKQSHKCYYANINGETVRLAKGPKGGDTEAAAYAEYAKQINLAPAALAPVPGTPAPVPGTPVPAPTGPTLGDLVAKFCAHVEANCPKETMLAYTRYSRQWATLHGHLLASEIAGHHITEAGNTLYPKVNKDHNRNNGKPYSDSVRCQHAKVAKQVFAYAKSEGYIKVNPVEGYRSKVKWGKREVDLSREEFDKLLAGCHDPAFRDLLIILWDCGCRPKEAFDATAKHLDREAKCLRYAKGKRGKPRVIYLTANDDRAFNILCRLADEHPTGPLLRNQIGNGWTIATASQRLRVLEARTSVKSTCYVFRHAFITRHVKAGMNLVTLQNLVGHSSLKMISEVYAHVGGDDQHLGKALRGAA
jgi:integrase